MSNEPKPLHYDDANWNKLSDEQRADVWAALERGYAHAKLDLELLEQTDIYKYKWLADLQKEASDGRRHFSKRAAGKSS